MTLSSRSVHGFEIYYRNEEEFQRIYQEVFIDEEYKFQTENPAPVILDCGAHIGLSLLYFKMRFKNAKIIAFEPNPDNFQILKKNVEVNNLQDVTLVEAAVSSSDGVAELYGKNMKGELPWTWGNSIIHNMWGDANTDDRIPVKSTRLSSYIQHSVDYLKLDIEGSEQQVIEEIAHLLGSIKELLIEYHGGLTSQHVNSVDAILDILKQYFSNIETTAKDIQKYFRPTSIQNNAPSLLLLHAQR